MPENGEGMNRINCGKRLIINLLNIKIKKVNYLLDIYLIYIILRLKILKGA